MWLPNALVDGAANEVPPIELIRQTRNVQALRLLIELYAVQFLPIYGGVPREVLRAGFDRKNIGEQGPFVVWGFRPAKQTAHEDLAGQFFTGQKKGGIDTGWHGVFWPAFRTLEDLGLIERIAMLCDGDDAEAEIIHPLGFRGGEPAERELAKAARSCAEAMITESHIEWAMENQYYYLVPAWRHIANAALIEVFRLKYRPHTTATAAWHTEMQKTTTQWLTHYRKISGHEDEQNVQSRLYQGSIKA